MVVFLKICCCPFGCVRKQNISTYASILAGEYIFNRGKENVLLEAGRKPGANGLTESQGRINSFSLVCCFRQGAPLKDFSSDSDNLQ